MMNRNEAVQKLATAGRLSIAHAEDLYDSLFEKPVVKQYVADWYEEIKGEFYLNLHYLAWDMFESLDEDACVPKKTLNDDITRWYRKNENAIKIIVNMHQRGKTKMNKHELYRRIEEMPYNHGIFIDTVKLSRRWLLGSISRLEEPSYSGIAELIDKVNEWAISHGLDKGNPKIEWMKVTEEVGEIRDVFLKPHDFADPEWSLKDAIGDSIVTLVVLCLQLGYDVEECLTIAYNDIKDRKGVMIDDNFVKTKTRGSANSSDDSASAIASD